MDLTGQGPGPFAEDLARDDLLAFGGSVGHLEAVDCDANGDVVISVALPEGNTAEAYEVERRFFTSAGAKIVLVRSRTERHTVDATGIDDFPEFAGSPFGSCD
jgi:hypothetical protein